MHSFNVMRETDQLDDEFRIKLSTCKLLYLFLENEDFKKSSRKYIVDYYIYET